MLHRLTGRTGRIVAQAGVLTAVVAGTAVYASVDKSVTLTVDGRSEQVHSFAGDVEGLLASQQISVGDRDLVAPAPSSELDDGDTVVVRYARRLTLTADGEPQVYWTTEPTVGGALSALGIRADGARLSASRSQAIGRSGLAMWMFTPKDVSLRADGRTRRVSTTAATVSDLLAEQSLKLGTLDKLSVVGTAPVVEGLAVKITRIEKRQVTKAESVEAGATRRSTSKLFKGQTKVLREGRDGRRSAVYQLVLTDGKVTSRKLVRATVTRAPVPAVVQVGTKSRPVSRPPAGGGADGLNWAALAECESGGNPNAVNPAGPYYGLYQFDQGTWQSNGGTGTPSGKSIAEQTRVAYNLYQARGRAPWPTCGRNL